MSETQRSPRDEEPNPMAEMWELRLFVAGSGPESARVYAALEQVCREHLPGRYHLTLVDVHQDPQQADAHDIVATPTLLRQLPLPVRRVIGNLALTEKVLVGLGIEAT